MDIREIMHYQVELLLKKKNLELQWEYLKDWMECIEEDIGEIEGIEAGLSEDAEVAVGGR